MNEALQVTAPGALGEWLHTKLSADCGLVTEEKTQATVRRVEAAIQRTRLHSNRFRVEVLALDEVTAFTTFGCYIYISHALARRLETDDALAFVIAHEMAHHDLGHIAVYQKCLNLMDLLPGSSVMAKLLTATERFLFSPEWELAADKFGLELCLSMGYDGARCLKTFDVLTRTALAHKDRDIVYGPDKACAMAASELEQWRAQANTWVWQRVRGYPCIEERKESLQALLKAAAPPVQNPTEVTILVPVRNSRKMNLDQIDQVLEEWRAKLQVSSDNLLALDDNLTYKRLGGKDGLPATQLSGVTQEQVTPAIDAVQNLFLYTGMLTRIVDRAVELRKSLSRFRAPDSTVREIEQLLYGPSIQLPSDQTPLAKRSLLSASEIPKTITPERLLTLMIKVFEEARDAVFAVDAAWNRLEPQLADCGNVIAALERKAALLGEASLTELADARQRVARLHTQIESDPLGASTNYAVEITPMLERARARLDQIQQQRDQAGTYLTKAREVLRQLEETRQQSETALRECREKVGDVPGLRAPLDPARTIELTQWLGTLETTWREGRWRPARVGVERWLETAFEYLNTERETLKANNAPVETCAELRGRLAALKVKARARGLAQDTSQEDIAREAEQFLNQYPIPLERTVQCVRRYEAEISARLLR